MPLSGRAVMLLAALIAGAAAIGVILSLRLAEDSRQQDLLAWQSRLAAVVDGRAQAVADWVAAGVEGLGAVAGNGAVQLYLGELAAGDGGADVDAAHLAYLRTLLIAAADRAGFVAPDPAAEIPANVERRGGAGMALVDARQRLLAATPGMPPPVPAVRAAIERALAGEPAVIDIHLGPSGLLTMGHALPIHALQTSAAAPAGVVVGLRIVDDGLFRHLRQPGETSPSAQTRLIRRAGPLIEYLSPGSDGTPPLGRSLDAETSRLADAMALARPGGFADNVLGIDGRPVLMVSRPVPGLPWTLVRTIDRDEALAGSRQRLVMLLAGLLAAVAMAALAVLAAWRHAGASRASAAADGEGRRAAALMQTLEDHRRREAMLDALVDGLVGIIDARDPHAVHHSARIAEVATAIARELGLGEAAVATLHMAARLSTLGRIAVPAALLTKQGDLTFDERALLAGAARSSADLLRHVPLDGGVAAIIEQIAERWDGGGPLGLAGDAILEGARILAVAYAFVGMISPRAHRPPLTIDNALTILHSETLSRFDRRPVSALANLLDNRGAAARWRQFQGGAIPGESRP